MPVLSGLQECNYMMLQYKQVMTCAQPPLGRVHWWTLVKGVAKDYAIIQYQSCNISTGVLDFHMIHYTQIWRKWLLSGK